MHILRADSLMMIRTGRLLYAAWAVAVAIVSLLPGDATPPTFGLSDIILHGVMYAAGGFCAALGWRNTRALAIALLGAAALGGGLELAQAAFTADRAGEWHDVASNIAGLLAGVILAQSVRISLRTD